VKTTAREWFRFGTTLAALVTAGCSGGETFEKVPHSGQVVEMEIKGKKIEAELSIDPSSRMLGLMNRESLPPDRGMLFIWPAQDHEDDRGGEGGLQIRGMWMKNTEVALSVAYLDEDGKILQIEDLRPHDERIIRSKDEVRFALEMNQGWFERNGVKVGDAFQDFRKAFGKLQAR